MNLTYVMEYRFRQASDGSVWTDTSYSYDFWGRYLRVFDRVSIVARASAEPPPENWTRVDGPNVSVIPLPHYLGLAEYAKRYFQVNGAIRDALSSSAAVILRIPSQLCTCAASYLIEKNRPFGVEVVGDPREALGRGVTEHPLRGVLQWWFWRNQMRQCARAATAAYVSRGLRSNYPPGPETAFVDCSDVSLDSDAFRWPARSWNNKKATSLVTVATLSQMYKGIDVLLDAMAICVRDGLDLHLTIVGDGKYRGVLEEQARRLDLANRVTFTGNLLAGPPVREHLDAADVFVLPSRTEGMPRALLEAMARGLPCIASRVGGIPDVIANRDLVPPGDPAALADRLWEVCNRPSRMNWMSARNLEVASSYRAELLTPTLQYLQLQLSRKTAPYLEGERSYR